MSKDLLINNFAIRFFCDVANYDYIAERMEYRTRLVPQCLWSLLRPQQGTPKLDYSCQTSSQAANHSLRTRALYAIPESRVCGYVGLNQRFLRLVVQEI